MDTNGYAPDDSNDEPYEIELKPNNKACPPIDTGVPVTASGCIWEQISAPAGDMTDDLEFTQAPDTSYQLWPDRVQRHVRTRRCGPTRARI